MKLQQSQGPWKLDLESIACPGPDRYIIAYHPAVHGALRLTFLDAPVTLRCEGVTSSEGGRAASLVSSLISKWTGVLDGYSLTAFM